MPFSAMLRVLSLAAMAACGVAVVVARSAPRPAAFRAQHDGHRAGISGHLFWDTDSAARVLDTTTGALARLPVPRDESLQWPSFSDWLDDHGEHHVVGRCVSFQGSGLDRVGGEQSLARYSYPSGRAVDRVRDCPMPASTPCWYPRLVSRVLYAATDGRLYECAFDSAGRGSAREATVRPVSWTKARSPLGDPFITHVVWPRGLNGCLIASLQSAETDRHRGRERLWWLKLSADGLKVAQAGPLPVNEPNDGDAADYRFPIVAPLPGGGHLIAYQRWPDDGRAELIVARLRIDAQTSVPAIDMIRTRKITDDALGVPAAFSADGTCVYVAQRSAGGHVEMRRFAVELCER